MKTTKVSRLVLGMLAGAAAAGTLTMTSGCFLFVVGAAGAVGAGTVAYVEGKLTAGIGRDYPTVVEASKKAIQQLQFRYIGELGRDTVSTQVKGETLEGTSVEITVSQVSPQLTKVEIRVGTFGDKALSQTILQKIQDNL